MKKNLFKILISVFLLMVCIPVFSQEKKITVGDIKNKISIGNLTGSRQLTFGFKNILLEFLQEKDYPVVEDDEAYDIKISLDLLFFDVETTKSNLSVFHRDNAETVLRVKAYAYDSSGKKIKEVVITEKSSEISVSTLVIDEGGGINQQSVSNVIKKVCDSAIKQLLTK
jgi:hypothetical protein